MHIHQMLNPGPGPVMPRAVVIGFTCLVLPVCSHTGFSGLLHGFSTQLNFNRHAVRAEQGGVQGLIAVYARYRDVVLEPAGHRPIQAVHNTETAITGIHAVHHNAKAEYINNFIE